MKPLLYHWSLRVVCLYSSLWRSWGLIKQYSNSQNNKISTTLDREDRTASWRKIPCQWHWHHLKSRSHEREKYGKSAVMNHGFSFGKEQICAERREWAAPWTSCLSAEAGVILKIMRILGTWGLDEFREHFLISRICSVWSLVGLS